MGGEDAKHSAYRSDGWALLASEPITHVSASTWVRVMVLESGLGMRLGSPITAPVRKHRRLDRKLECDEQKVRRCARRLQHLRSMGQHASSGEVWVDLVLGGGSVGLQAMVRIRPPGTQI